MPKINIYVPDDMKDRMDATGERANWSAVAQRAFDLELNHLEAVKEIKTMTDVIERLKVSKEKVAANSESDGREVGRDWAQEDAEYDELKRVAGLDTNVFNENFLDDPDWVCRKMVVVAVAGGEDAGKDILRDKDDTAQIFGLDHDDLDMTLTREFLVGFVTGADEVWQEVKDEI